MPGGNNIFVISTGAANEINASGYNLEGRANYIRTKIKRKRGCIWLIFKKKERKRKERKTDSDKKVE